MNIIALHVVYFIHWLFGSVHNAQTALQMIIIKKYLLNKLVFTYILHIHAFIGQTAYISICLCMAGMDGNFEFICLLANDEFDYY